MKPKLIRAALVLTILLSTFVLQYGASASPAQQDPTPPAEPTGPGNIYLPFMVQHSPSNSIFGVEIEQMDSSGLLLNNMASAGATWIRRNSLFWSDVEPTKGAPLQWSANLDSELKSLGLRGMNTILIVRNAPAWARENVSQECGRIKSSEFTAFANFLSEAVKRYSGYPYNVKYWEIWNEPDVPRTTLQIPFGCWGDNGDSNYGGGYYGEMLKVVYPAIKAANPNAQVLIGGLLMDCDPALSSCTYTLPSRFLRGILEAGAGNSFDGISFHAYDYYDPGLQYKNSKWNSNPSTGPVVLAKARFIRSLLASYGISGKYLINTETALIDASGTCSDACEQAKVNYVPQTYAAALAADLKANIWYSATGWRGSGLVGKPAYNAFVFASNMFTDARYVRTEDSYPGVKAYVLQAGARVFWVAWSTDGAAHQITLNSAPRAIFDAAGNPIPTNGTSVTVDKNTIYIQW